MKNKTFKKILCYVKKYWFFLVLSIIFATITVVFTLYVPILIGDIIDLIVEDGKIPYGEIITVSKKVIVIVIVIAISQWLMNITNNYITYSTVRDIRCDAFKKIASLPLKYIDSHSYGEIVSRVISDVDQFADGLLMGFTQLFTGVMTIFGTLVFMIIINHWIALLVVVLTPISLFIAKYIATKTYTLFQDQNRLRGIQTGYIEEMITNQKVVQAYSLEEQTTSKFDDINKSLEKSSLKAVFYSSLVNPSTRFVNALIYAVVAVFGAIIRLSIGQLSCFLSYVNQYTKPFNEISGVIAEFQNALSCASRIFNLIEEETETDDSENTKLDVASGKVNIEHVNFSYNPEIPLITDFSLDVKKGQHVAIVGPTGCGKTTMINLLMRFYDCTSGEIKVDNINIQSLQRKSLRQNYGMVLQDTWLKNATIKENIALGKKDATDEEIIMAAKRSHAHSFIKRLPNGYNTIISESNDGLSQGQKQLLCIARVMLCLPPMLILDEATSSIDARTELLIQEAFNMLTLGKTSFIVAHRLKTIQNADIILVMDKGNVIEKGTHLELLEKKGFYYNLYNSQFTI